MHTRIRTFAREDLIAWNVVNRHEDPDDEDTAYCSPEYFDDIPTPVVSDELTRVGDDPVRTRVFRAPDDGRLYAIEYEVSGSKVGVDEMDPPYLHDWYDGYEVEPETITKVTYVPKKYV